MYSMLLKTAQDCIYIQVKWIKEKFNRKQNLFSLSLHIASLLLLYALFNLLTPIQLVLTRFEKGKIQNECIEIL